jgi:hypothetical protein
MLPVLTPIFGLVSRAWDLPAIYLASAILLFALSLWAFGVRKRMDVRAADGAAGPPTKGT